MFNFRLENYHRLNFDLYVSIIPLGLACLSFKNLSFVITRGQSVGLVGPSGGGKSTVFQLLQRFYDPTPALGRYEKWGHLYHLSKFEWKNGGKRFENIDQLCEYRSRIGYVGQEPVLFNLSCLENVMYGLAEGKRNALSKFDIQNVADMCNIDFVKPLVKAQNARKRRLKQMVWSQTSLNGVMIFWAQKRKR